MATCAHFGRVLRLGTWLLVAGMATTVLAASGSLKGAGKFNPDHETVDFFTAIEEGRLEAKLIPRDSKQCNLLIENVSDKPVNVAMPDVFAAVPVLAQLRNNQFGNNQFGNANNMGAPQQLGVGNRFGNQFGNQGNMNMMNNNPQQFNLLVPDRLDDRANFAPFNVAPEKVARLTLPSVCLEHGKKEPQSSMAYTVKPIDAATEKAQAHEICRMLGRGEIDQRVAQAAAWHLANDLGWDALAAKRVRVLGYGHRRYFTPQQLALAKDAVGDAFAAAARREPPVLARGPDTLR
jgi:hypothetical protein